ncbi:hypothetical protein [Streptomyces sp. NPDC051569]|uniref:hypothetical protein n=1 Tax=Streptomyces sp. NPDC051569 TaxID=3365661 RepID=UPI0037A6C5E7
MSSPHGRSRRAAPSPVRITPATGRTTSPVRTAPMTARTTSPTIVRSKEQHP